MSLFIFGFIPSMHLVINAVGARAGGAVTHLNALLPRLEEFNDIDFTVLIDSRSRPKVSYISGHNVKLHPIDFGSRTQRVLWDRLRLPPLLKRLKADALLSLLNHGPRRSPVPQIILQRNPWYFARHRPLPLPRSRFELAIRRRLALDACRGSAVVVVPTEALKADLQTWMQHPRIEVLPHGLDTRFFSSSSHNLKDLPARLQTSGSPRLLYVSHVEAYKGHAELLEAFRAIKDRLPQATLALTFGEEEPVEYDPRGLVPGLVSMAQGMRGVALVGSHSQLGVRALYEWADIVVFPSRVESFGFPLIEAMSMSRPVIASAIPSLLELGRGVAIFHRPQDPGSIAEEVVKLASDPDEMEARGRLGRERALGFDWDRYGRRLIGLVREVTDGRDLRLS